MKTKPETGYAIAGLIFAIIIIVFIILFAQYIGGIVNAYLADLKGMLP